MGGRIKYGVTSLSGAVIALSLCAHAAHGQRERVMGAADEGAQHRLLYLNELDRKAAERMHCQELIDQVIHPELAQYAALGLSRQHGPSRALFDESNLKRALEKSDSYRLELLRLARALSSATSSQAAQTKSQFNLKMDRLMHAYQVQAQATQGFAKEALQKREVVSLRFQAFAKAVLAVRRSPECHSLWKSLKVHIPLRLGQRVLQEKYRASALLATIDQKNMKFSGVLAQIRLSVSGRKAVADSPER